MVAVAGGKLIVIDFCHMVWALQDDCPSHGRCQKPWMMLFLKVDVDECEDIAEQHNVCMPTLFPHKDGKTGNNTDWC